MRIIFDVCVKKNGSFQKRTDEKIKEKFEKIPTL